MVRGGKKLDNELLKQKLLIAKMLYQKGFRKKKIDAILSFLNNYVRFARPETNRIFETELDKITGKINTMGIIEQVKEMRLEEAREAGRIEEKKEVVKRLIQATQFTPKKIATIAGVSLAFVEKVKRPTK